MHVLRARQSRAAVAFRLTDAAARAERRFLAISRAPRTHTQIDRAFAVDAVTRSDTRWRRGVPNFDERHRH